MLRGQPAAFASQRRCEAITALQNHRVLFREKTNAGPRGPRNIFRR
jgi:hypothetical protein